MMETADTWHAPDRVVIRLPAFDEAPSRRLLVWRVVNAILVIVADVVPHQPAQMVFVQHRHMSSAVAEGGVRVNPLAIRVHDRIRDLLRLAKYSDNPSS